MEQIEISIQLNIEEIQRDNGKFSQIKPQSEKGYDSRGRISFRLVKTNVNNDEKFQNVRAKSPSEIKDLASKATHKPISKLAIDISGANSDQTIERHLLQK